MKRKSPVHRFASSGRTIQKETGTKIGPTHPAHFSLAEILCRKRPYASYFHFGGDKRGTEIDVVCDWLEARYPNSTSAFSKLEYRKNPDDPPDVVLVDHDGSRHGIEVTEFVDGRTISAHVKSHSGDMREYEEEEFRALVLERIAAKSRVPFKDATCTSKRLIIYSDEPIFICGDGVLFLSRFPVAPSSSFDEVWFMIPPAVDISGGEPKSPHCRIYKIKKDRS
jgi:hypothetical protein